MDDLYCDYFNNNSLLLESVKNEACFVDENTVAIRVIRTDNSVFYILIDIEDYAKCCKYRWRVKINNNTYYAYTSIKKDDGTYFTTTIHRVIMFDDHLNSDPNIMVDHINRNGLDNRKLNLRYCDNRQNQWNARVASNNLTGVTGVSYTKGLDRYLAQIKLPDGRNLWKSFSCKKVGRGNALQLAIKQRYDWENMYHIWNK